MSIPDSLTDMTARIVSAYLGRGVILLDQVPGFIRMVHRTLVEVDGRQPTSAVEEPRVPMAVAKPVMEVGAVVADPHPSEDAEGSDADRGYVRDGRRSVYPDGILCLDDGRKVVFLRRHLKMLGVEEEDYRRRWGFPADYPMVSSGYVDEKRRLALKTGFGRLVNPNIRKAAATNGSGHAGRVSGTLSPAYAG